MPPAHLAQQVHTFRVVFVIPRYRICGHLWKALLDSGPIIEVELMLLLGKHAEARLAPSEPEHLARLLVQNSRSTEVKESVPWWRGPAAA